MRNASKSNSSATRRTLFLVGAVLLFILAWGLGLLPTVPNSLLVNVQAMDRLPKLPENAPGELWVRSDASVFDLRAWRPVAPYLAFTRPMSPANYTNYLRVVKQRPCERLYAHYATGGYGINLQCITHAFRAYEAADNVHGKEGAKNYALEVDISREPVGAVFFVLVQATYWNGFRDNSTGDAMTYIDAKGQLPEELSLCVLFPSGKPSRSLELSTSRDDGKTWPTYPLQQEAFRDDSGRFVRWTIKDRSPDTHYRIAWKW